MNVVEIKFGFLGLKIGVSQYYWAESEPHTGRAKEGHKLLFRLVFVSLI